MSTYDYYIGNSLPIVTQDTTMHLLKLMSFLDHQNHRSFIHFFLHRRQEMEGFDTQQLYWDTKEYSQGLIREYIEIDNYLGW